MWNMEFIVYTPNSQTWIMELLSIVYEIPNPALCAMLLPTHQVIKLA